MDWDQEVFKQRRGKMNTTYVRIVAKVKRVNTCVRLFRF